MRRGGAPAEVHHGAGGRSSEWFGAGAAVSLVHGCNRSAARSDDLASGQRARHKGHDIAAVAATVADARRGGERLRARYNAQGLQALGDLRCRNGRSPSVLKPDLLDKLQDRLPPGPPASRTACVSRPRGGLWTSPKVAAWMASELGLAQVAPQRGWEALKAIGWSVIGWSVQKPRPRHPASVTPEERARSGRPSKKAGAGRR
jgi:hypothetical protein